MSSRNKESAVGRVYSDLATDWETEEKWFDFRQKKEAIFTPSTYRPAFGPTRYVLRSLSGSRAAGA
jgi:hypothetical protein